MRVQAEQHNPLILTTLPFSVLWVCMHVCEWVSVCWRADLQCWVHWVGGWGGEMRPRGRGRVRERWVWSQKNSGCREKCMWEHRESQRSTELRHTQQCERFAHAGPEVNVIPPTIITSLLCSLSLCLSDKHTETHLHTKHFVFSNDFWADSFSLHFSIRWKPVKADTIRLSAPGSSEMLEVYFRTGKLCELDYS